jgi:hypothetical protein
MLWIIRLDPFSCGDMVVDIGDWLVSVVEFARPNSPTHVSFLVSIFYFSHHFKFSFDGQNPSFYTWLQPCWCVISLLLTARIETLRATLGIKWITVTVVIFQDWKLNSYREETVEFWKQSTSWKVILEPMNGNCRYIRGRFLYVVLSRAEKHVPYGELVGATECVTL